VDEEDSEKLEVKPLDNLDLEIDTQMRMTSGHDNVDHDAGEGLLIMIRMAKVVRVEKL